MRTYATHDLVAGSYPDPYGLNSSDQIAGDSVDEITGGHAFN